MNNLPLPASGSTPDPSPGATWMVVPIIALLAVAALLYGTRDTPNTSRRQPPQSTSSPGEEFQPTAAEVWRRQYAAGLAKLRDGNLDGWAEIQPLLLADTRTPAEQSEVAAAIKALLAKPDLVPAERLRLAAVCRSWPKAFPELTEADFRPLLLGLLKEPDPAVRVEAALLFNDAAAVPTLFEVINASVMNVGLVARALRSPRPELADARDRLAWDRAVPVALRVKAAALQRAYLPARLLSARLLEAAVTDAEEDPQFRAFAAWFFAPDTAERFATAVRLLAVDDARLKTLRRVLALRLRDQFASGNRPPKEWVTDELATVMAGSASRFRVPQAEPGFDALGNAGIVQPNTDQTGADLDGMYADLLVARGAAVVPALVANLDNPSAGLRNLTVLEKLGPAAADAIPTLLRFFDPLLDEAGTLEANAWNRIAAAKVFAAIGPRAKAAAGTLARELLGYYHVEVLGDFWPAIVRTGGDRVAALIPLLTSAEGFPPQSDLSPRRKWAADRLARLGPDAKSALPALLARIQADFATDVSPFVQAVAAVGPDAVVQIGELLGHKEPKVRIAAAFALALIGPECRSKATPLLIQAIDAEKNAEVKAALLNALGAINPAAAERLGWHRVEAEREPPRLVAHPGGRLELVRPTPPQAAHHFTQQSVPIPMYLPRPYTPPPRVPIRTPTPVRIPVRIR